MAASGMRSRMESLDLLANNIANASTGGYKADREFYSLYAEEENTATMPVIQKPYTDLSQGVLQTTGNPLDLAISGQGFFTVQGPSGPLIHAQRKLSPGSERQADQRRRLRRARDGGGLNDSRQTADRNLQRRNGDAGRKSHRPTADGRFHQRRRIG